jgi:ABC-2 type transport system ATP-binding protein
VSIVLNDVSKFYGEVLGVNHVNLVVPPGLTSLVGPNGSGKTTLMNLLTGLIRPTRGKIEVLGISPDRPEDLFRRVGYCTQHDSFPRGLTGRTFVESYLRLHGVEGDRVRDLAAAAIERTGMTAAAGRRVGGYSKGMRQRIKLALALAHDPDVLLLDEPLNGLDPMARSEVIALLRSFAGAGRYVIVSSHILHEVDLISDRVVILTNGSIAAEGGIQGVRGEIDSRPHQILVRCDRPADLASRAFALDHVTSIQMHRDRRGLLVSTRDADRFYELLNRLVLDEGLGIETVAPADEDVHALYQYLVGGEEEGA